MNKDYKPINTSFREHFHIWNYLSPEMIEQLLDKVDDLECEVTALERINTELDKTTEYWRNRYEAVI